MAWWLASAQRQRSMRGRREADAAPGSTQRPAPRSMRRSRPAPMAAFTRDLVLPARFFQEMLKMGTCEVPGTAWTRAWRCHVKAPMKPRRTSTASDQGTRRREGKRSKSYGVTTFDGASKVAPRHGDTWRPGDGPVGRSKAQQDHLKMDVMGSGQTGMMRTMDITDPQGAQGVGRDVDGQGQDWTSLRDDLQK